MCDFSEFSKPNVCGSSTLIEAIQDGVRQPLFRWSFTKYRSTLGWRHAPRYHSYLKRCQNAYSNRDRAALTGVSSMVGAHSSQRANILKHGYWSISDNTTVDLGCTLVEANYDLWFETGKKNP